MKTGGSPRRFGAFIEQYGIDAVEYRRERDGISILNTYSDRNRVNGLADAGERLAALLQSAGAVDAELSVAVRGFGTTYQLMMLPPAAADVLGPVVRRELLRTNPELSDARVEFVMGGEVDRRRRNRPDVGRAQQEVLVGAAPGLAVTALGEELRSAGILLTHLTVLPQVAQRLFEHTDSSFEPTALLIMLQGGPVLAFFHERQLRLVVEPPFVSENNPQEDARELVEHIDRGSLYLRQQFRGIELTRVLLAAETTAGDPLLTELETQLSVPVRRLPGQPEVVGALMALGAVLDSESDAGLNLSPFAESPGAVTERRKRRTARIASAAFAGVAVLWALFNIFSAVRWSNQVKSLSRDAAARSASLATIRSVVQKRQQTASGAAFLQSEAAGEIGLQNLLRSIARATPPGVQLNDITSVKAGADWQVSISGAALGESGAAVLLGVDRLFRSIPREMPVRELVVAELGEATATETLGTTMSFRMTFVASPPTAP